MASLAQTLALLAMAVVTVASDVVHMDMAKNSFDDQYLSCGDSMTQILPELQKSDFANDTEFKKDWDAARVEWEERGSDSSPLSPDQAVALMAYTTHTPLFERFNRAVSQAGKSSEEYRNNFHFKSLHFLLTQALQTLSNPQKCYDVFRGASKRFEAQTGDKVRFGQFASTSLKKQVAQGFGLDTLFMVYTCHGASIKTFSQDPDEEEVLIPPFETFEVLASYEEGNTKHIKLRSTGKSSNYECEWLTGGSLPSNVPHLGGLLLATVAMAVAIGTL